MLRPLRTLQKVALTVNLIFLLITVLCRSVYSLVLYNDCSHQFVGIDMKGHVFAWDNQLHNYGNLTIISLDFSLKLQIFAEESQRYLCFGRNWRLYGRQKKNEKEHPRRACLFHEETLKSGYTRYRSVMDKTRYIGFNKRGKPMTETRVEKLGDRRQCLNFLKLNFKYFDIQAHNNILTGANTNKTTILKTKLTSNNNNSNNNSNNLNGHKRRKHKHKKPILPLKRDDGV